MSDTVENKTDSYMDERLKLALETAKYRTTLYNQRKNSELKFKQALSFSKNGGIFFVDQTLISFVNALIQADKESAILIDVNGNPIEIASLEDFYDDILDTYFSASNTFLAEIKKIQQSRKIEPMLGW